MAEVLNRFTGVRVAERRRPGSPRSRPSATALCGARPGGGRAGAVRGGDPGRPRRARCCWSPTRAARSSTAAPRRAWAARARPARPRRRCSTALSERAVRTWRTEPGARRVRGRAGQRPAARLRRRAARGQRRPRRRRGRIRGTAGVPAEPLPGALRTSRRRSSRPSSTGRRAPPTLGGTPPPTPRCARRSASRRARTARIYDAPVAGGGTEAVAASFVPVYGSAGALTGLHRGRGAAVAVRRRRAHRHPRACR